MCAGALLLAALSCLILHPAPQPARSGRASPPWLAGWVLVQVIAELSLSPVGLSGVSRLAPAGVVKQMMGVWFRAAAVGNLAAGLLGGQASSTNLDQAGALFCRAGYALLTSLLRTLTTPAR